MILKDGIPGPHGFGAQRTAILGGIDHGQSAGPDILNGLGIPINRGHLDFVSSGGGQGVHDGQSAAIIHRKDHVDAPLGGEIAQDIRPSLSSRNRFHRLIGLENAVHLPRLFEGIEKPVDSFHRRRDVGVFDHDQLDLLVVCKPGGDIFPIQISGLVIVGGPIGGQLSAADILVVGDDGNAGGVGLSEGGGERGIIGRLHDEEIDARRDQFPHLLDLVFNPRFAIPGDAALQDHRGRPGAGGFSVDRGPFMFQARAHGDLARNIHGPVQRPDAEFLGLGPTGATEHHDPA